MYLNLFWDVRWFLTIQFKYACYSSGDLDLVFKHAGVSSDFDSSEIGSDADIGEYDDDRV